MNVDRIIQMAMRMLMRRGIGAGIAKATQVIAARGKRAEDMTDDDRQQAARMQGQARQAQRLMRQTRRFR